MPRSRNSSEAPSARSTRSAKSRRSASSSHSTAADSVSTRASSVASSIAIHSESPTPDALVAPTTTPEESQFLDSTTTTSSDNLAQYINIVHMDHMARYLQSPESQQRLDTMLHVVKDKKRKSDADSESGSGVGGSGGGSMNANGNSYQSALSELDYLEGLFKKLRFSYKEQLTKETVVRRILELELPLLSAADIDHMVQDTDAERRRLRALKSAAHDQGEMAEQTIRELATERRYIAMAEGEMAHLPDRLLKLRRRLLRLKLAIRSELASIDQAQSERDSSSTPFSCGQCTQKFHNQEFRQLHEALHGADPAMSPLRGGSGRKADDERMDLDDDDAAARPNTALKRCRGCDQQVPALFLENAPAGESHDALHARIQQAARDAAERLAAATAIRVEDMELQQETLDVVEALQLSEADVADMEARVRAEAERQAAIEGEMTASLQQLRDSVGSIRIEMKRLEAEADRMAQYMEEGHKPLGRTLQEQSELLAELLVDDDGED